MRGSKGKKPSTPKARTPIEAPNTLQSKNTARIIDLLCEGPIEGLINGAQSIYLDNTPLGNDDGTFNFEGVKWDYRIGEPDQEHLAGFPEVESEVNVGVKVTQDTPVVRTITDTDIDALRVKLRVPAISSTSSSTGDINPTEIQFNIELQSNGGEYAKVSPHSYSWSSVGGSQTTSTEAYGIRATVSDIAYGSAGTKHNVTVTAQYRAVGATDWIDFDTATLEGTVPAGASSVTLSTTFELTGLAADQYEVRATAGTLRLLEQYTSSALSISGKATSPYEESYRFDLTGDPPYNVRVTRITPDSDTVSLQNDLYFSTYTKIVDAKLSYPDSALVGIEVDAELFGGQLPSRSYDIKGIKILVPDNYDPVERTYTGIWSGEFQLAWSDNPAWVLYDIITNNRYGCGDYIDSTKIDKWSFYDIGVYCDELVDDGFGGQEPRFTFNGVLNSRRSAYEVINALSSAFRGMTYWDQGQIFAVQDAPQDAHILVSPANVIDGMFEYSSSDLSVRHTAAAVTWNDPQDGYDPTIEVVQLDEDIQKFGWKQLDTVAFGCTSRGQAHRWGRWILYTEKYETEMVSYKASFDHIECRPGDIIKIADPMYANVRYGGRIGSVTEDTIQIDQAVTLAEGQTYTMSYVLPDGTVEDQTVQNLAGETDTIQLDYFPTQPPVVGAMWVLSGDVEPRQFRVISIREAEKGIFEVTAALHHPGKYDLVENDIALTPYQYTTYTTGPLAAPTDLSLQEYKYRTLTVVKSAALFSWTPPADPRVSFYEVFVKVPESSSFQAFGKVSGTSITIEDTTQGTYTFRVRARDYIGSVTSQYAEESFEIQGLLDTPADVENFSMNVIDGTAYLSWDAVTDLDLDHYELRYHPAIGAINWGSMNVLTDYIPATSTSIHLPLTTGTYAIVAVDTSNIKSANPTFIYSNVLDVLNRNVVQTVNLDFSTGTLTDVGSADGSLVLAGADTVDDWTSIDDVVNWDIGNEGLAAYGVYEIPAEQMLDLGDIYTSRITPNIVASGSDWATSMDTWVNIDDVGNWDGAEISDWEVEFQLQHTSDEVDVSPLFSEWKRCIVGDYTARGFNFRLLLRSFRTGITPVVESASVTIDMPDRVIGSNEAVATGGGPTTITFSPAFKHLDALGITAENLNSGDRYEITGKSATGFTIEFFDDLGNTKEAVFDYIARGYGSVSNPLPLA